MSGQTPADRVTPPTDRVDPSGEHPPRRRVEVTLGPHLGGRRPPSLALCEELMDEVGSISHLARYRTGTCDFALDADEPVGPHGPLGLSGDERQLIGRDVVHVMTDLAEQLRPAASGDLVRMLLHTDRGALFVLSVLREQFLVALGWSSGEPDRLPPRDPAVRAADIELAGLANRLRDAVSQQPTDYGGWLGLDESTLSSGVRELRSELPGPPTALDGDPTGAGDGPPAVDATAVSSSAATPASVAALCRRYLDVDDLHYVALCRPGQVRVAEDVLDHPRLARFFDETEPKRRRQFYTLLGQRADGQLRTLVRATHLALGTRVRRLVLDVEQGALFCYPVGLDSYLLAVTLDQRAVWAADDKAARLARRLGT